jgi:hypothetical protein
MRQVAATVPAKEELFNRSRKLQCKKGNAQSGTGAGKRSFRR